MAIRIFFCYAHEDEALLIQLKAQLKPLEQQGMIETWYDGKISAGTEWKQEIGQRLNKAQIILLLVSPDFMNSEYCYGTELQQALERHKRGEALVVPVIGRPVYWQGILGHLQVLPKDALPITDPKWHNQDRALHNVAEGLREIVALMLSMQKESDEKGQQSVSSLQSVASPPASTPSPQLHTMLSSTATPRLFCLD